MNSFRKDVALLSEVKCHWERMAPFRKERTRSKRYCYGDQWGDQVNVDGRWMREEQYIRSQGSEPLKNNLIRRLVKQVLGLYRSEREICEVVCDDRAAERWMQKRLLSVRRDNSTDELEARALEEFLISGMVVQRKTLGRRNNQSGCWTDNVSPDRFFVDSQLCDNRGWDVELIGEIHDMKFDALLAAFGRSPSDISALAAIYSSDDAVQRYLSNEEVRGLCRVYEVWRKERVFGMLCHDHANGQLYWWDGLSAPHGEAVAGEWTNTTLWRYYFLSPDGDVLAEGDTPYFHHSHPYVFKAYPFIDGEIHSFVGDVIDQQRYTNRLITLYDWVMRSSAKGVLLVPEESLAEGYTMADVADEWARFNGVIPVRTRNGAQLPHQVSANAVNIGINELLQTQLGMMEDISGVTGALQGKTANASVSGVLYEQQTRNATLSQLDLLDTFRNFIREGMKKDVSNIRQHALTHASMKHHLPPAFAEATFEIKS